MESCYAAGIDCGSAFCKGALLRKDAEAGVTAAKLCAFPAGWNVRETSAKTLAALFAALPADTAGHPTAADAALPAGAAGALRPAKQPVIAATGYGRERVPQRVKTITEISAHAAGAEFLCPGARTLIDIGGQDCKVITVRAGNVLDFQMNDKCAAGSGRFLEAVAGRLGLRLSGRPGAGEGADGRPGAGEGGDGSPGADETEALLALRKSAALSSTCVVFAESEITALIAQGVPRESILGGVADAMAARIAALASRLSLTEPVVLSGGLSESAGIARALSRALKVTVRTLRNGAYAGALGAALAALRHSQGPRPS